MRRLLHRRGAGEAVAPLSVPLVSALLAALGGAGFLAVFEPGDLVLPVGVGATTGVLSGTVGGAVVGALSRRGRGGLLRLPALIVLTGAGTVAGAVVGLGTGGGPADLVRIGDGWSRMLGGHTPLPARPEMVALPYLATAVAAVSGVRLADARGWRPSSWAPSLAVLALGVAVGGPQDGVPVVVPLAWAAVALGSAGLRGDRERNRGDGVVRPGIAAGLAALALLATVAAVSAAVGSVLPGEDSRRVLPRTAELRPAPDDQPLGALAVLPAVPDEVLYTVDTPVPVPRWRLVALDRYSTGGRWSSDLEVRPAARRFPSGSGCDSLAGPESTHNVTVHQPPDAEGRAGAGAVPGWGRWLPTPGGVRETSVEGLGLDLGTGSLWVPEDVRVPGRYEITAVHPDADRAVQAPTGDPAGRPPETVGSDEEDLLAELATRARELVAGATDDHERALWIQQFLLDGELIEYEDAVEAGTSLRHVHDLVVGDTPRGTPEQLITAYVLLARSVELPARVVVGFEGGPAAGRYDLSAHDISTWAEVCFEETGWLPFEVLPGETGEVVAPREVAPPPERDSGAEEEDDDLSEDDDEGGEEVHEEAGGNGRDLAVPAPSLPVIGILAVVLVAGAVAAPGLRRGVRRRRRRRAGAVAGQVAGAWHQVLDELRAGGRGLDGATVAEVVTEGSRRRPVVAPSLDELGRLANRSTFARRPPAGGDGERAWELADTVVAGCRRSLGRWGRVRRYFRWS